EVLPRPGDDRDQVHDDLATRGGGAQACRVGHVALGYLAPPGLERPGTPWVANEAADVAALGAQRMDDLGADEPRAAGDKDLHLKLSSTPAPSAPPLRPLSGGRGSGAARKFFQYRLGVCPRWPWYCEPSRCGPAGAS